MKTLLSSILAFFMILSMSAQVGVNNPNPEQALDVNGKVKLANDAIAPSAGTMRYDATSSDFEGYNGTRWNSFTQSRSSGLPSNAVPVHGYNIYNVARNTRKSLTFKNWQTGTTFQTPPEGKFLIVTSVYSYLQSTSTVNQIYGFNIGVSPRIDNFPEVGDAFLTLFSDRLTPPLVGDGAPLFVLLPGEYITVSNNVFNFNFDSLYVTVRGFLVDDLDY
uniref:hypothetical protein n=2 Tax=Mariniflexile sp. TaxID=1979402 RepID=UPI00404780A3